MSEQKEASKNVLAGEYVLGTLKGDARVQFEKEMQLDEALRKEVAAWEKRLAPMLESVEPVAPPAAVWDTIERETAPRDDTEPGGFWYSLVFWRNFGLATATLLVVLSLQLFQPGEGLVSAERMMVVLNDRSQAGWVVGASHDGLFRVQAVQPTLLPQGQVCQLWMQTPDNQLVSLGVLPHSGVQTFRSPTAVPADARYKVSVEAADKLPLDRPLGEIVFEGELIPI